MPHTLQNGVFEATLDRWKPAAVPLELISIATRNEDGSNCRECVIKFELPEKVTLEVHYERSTAEEIFYDIEVIDVDYASYVLEDAVNFGYVHKREETVDLVHEARVAVRKKCAELMKSQGILVLLEETKLQWSFWQRYDGDYLHVISLSMLGDDLRPATYEIEVPLRSDHGKELDILFSKLPERHSRASQVQSSGADGTIDMLALRAIEAGGSIRDGLRNFVCLINGSGCLVSNGHLYLHQAISDKPRTVAYRSRLEIHGINLPENALLSSKGKPITKFVSCDLLSPEMIITRMGNHRDGQKIWLSIDFDQPVFDFCSLSGRFWQSKCRSSELSM